MPVAGAKPKADRSQIRHRVQPVHDWTDVEDVPFEGAPPLPKRESQVSYADAGVVPGSGWPESTEKWWAAVSTMPHCKLWRKTDWRFAIDTAEVHARTMEAWRGYTGAELRAREKLLGMLDDHRRDLRIRYVEPKPSDETETPAGVTNLRDYRNL
jgi:hypothetical protein